MELSSNFDNQKSSNSEYMEYESVQQKKHMCLRRLANKYREKKFPSLTEWSGISEFVFWAETEGY